MRKIVLAGVAVGALAAVGLTPEAALARDYPFCMKGEEYFESRGRLQFRYLRAMPGDCVGSACLLRCEPVL